MSSAINLIAGCCRVIPNGMRGKARLAKALFGPALSAQDVVLKDRFGNLFSIPSLREPVGFHLLIDGIYEPEVMAVILERLRSGSIFLDVGANIGAFSIPAARKTGPSGKVLAIEASPKIFSHLARNVNLNQLGNVRCFNEAASDAEATLPFYEAPAHQFGMGSLAAQFHDRPVMVPARRIDEILQDEKIDRVDLIKMDVEGFEAKALRGAENILRHSTPPLIVFEFVDWAEKRVPGGKVGDAQRFLLGLGFSIWRLADFGGGRPPLSSPVVSGAEMLVASR